MGKSEGLSAQEQLNTGKKLLREGAFAQAEEIFRSLTENRDISGQAWSQLGILQVRQNNRDEARVSFERSIAVDPANPAPYSNLGALAHEAGDLDQAIEYCQRALELDPDYPAALHNMGVIYRKKGDIWNSVRYLKRSTKAELRRRRRKRPF